MTKCKVCSLPIIQASMPNPHEDADNRTNTIRANVNTHRYAHDLRASLSNETLGNDDDFDHAAAPEVDERKTDYDLIRKSNAAKNKKNPNLGGQYK